MVNEMMNRHNDLFDAMNDWFDLPRKFFDDSEINKLMQTDVAEDDHQYVIKVDLPGMAKNDIQLNYQNEILSIAGTRNTEQQTHQDGNLIHRERSVGHVSRSFRLPNVIADQIQAHYDNGVLTVILPKQQATDNDHSIQID